MLAAAECSMSKSESSYPGSWPARNIDTELQANTASLTLFGFRQPDCQCLLLSSGLFRALVGHQTLQLLHFLQSLDA